jgi:signal transduction histidine kinase
MSLFHRFSFKTPQNILGYRYFYIFIVAVVFISSVCFSYIIYKSCYNDLKRKVNSEANHINNVLEDIFDETANIMDYIIGKQIAQNNYNDLNTIANILANSSIIASKTKRMYSWSLFDWVSTDGKTVVNSQMGIMSSPIDNSRYTFNDVCREFPNTLQLSHPTIGHTSGMWVIPAGMGVVDKTRKYIGLLAVGFNVAELNTKIAGHLADGDTSFLVLDNEFRIILQSANNAIDPKSSYFKDLLHDTSYFTKKSGELTKPIEYKNLTYYHYKRMEKYPYIILTGFENSAIYREFQSQAIPQIAELLLMGIFCFLLLYFFRKRLLAMTQSSHIMRDQLLTRLNLEMQTTVGSILTICDVLLRYYKGEIDVGISPEKKIELVTQIQENARSFNDLTTSVLSLSYVDINNLIREGIVVVSHTSMIKNIIIKTSLQLCLPPLYADEVRIKQIVISILSLFLEYNPNNAKIKISTFTRSFKKNRYLVIKFQDDGFSLNIDDIRRISERFDTMKAETNGLNLEFTTVEKLIQSHHGKYYLYSHWKGDKKGKNFVIIIPYSTIENTSLSRLNSPQDNVIHLPKKDRTLL